MDLLDSSLLGLGLLRQREALALSRSVAEQLDPEGLAVALAADASRPGPSVKRMDRGEVRRHVERYAEMAQRLRPL